MGGPGRLTTWPPQPAHRSDPIRFDLAGNAQAQGPRAAQRMVARYDNAHNTYITHGTHTSCAKWIDGCSDAQMETREEGSVRAEGERKGRTPVGAEDSIDHSGGKGRKTIAAGAFVTLLVVFFFPGMHASRKAFWRTSRTYAHRRAFRLHTFTYLST